MRNYLDEFLCHPVNTIASLFGVKVVPLPGRHTPVTHSNQWGDTDVDEKGRPILYLWRLTTFPPGFLTIIPPGGPSLLRDELASA